MNHATLTEIHQNFILCFHSLRQCLAGDTICLFCSYYFCRDFKCSMIPKAMHIIKKHHNHAEDFFSYVNGIERFCYDEFFTTLKGDSLL